MHLLDNQVGFLYLILAFVFFITHILVRTFPPKGINGIYGYRTPRSMKNEETWQFAQDYSNSIMRILAFVYLGVSAIFYYYDVNFYNDLYIMLTVMVLSLGVLVFFTERALKKTFDN